MGNLDDAVWRKSSRSTDQGECVELAQIFPDLSAVRDSKAPEHGTLVFAKPRIAAFVSAIKAGRYDG